MRTPSRIFVVLLAALALFAGACVDDGELGGPSVGGSFAVSVGERSLTHRDLAAMVDDWAANPDFLGDAVGITELGTPGARPADLVNFVLTFWLLAEQAEVVVPVLDPSFDLDGETAATVQGLAAQIPTFGDYDEDFQRQIARWDVAQRALSELVQQGPADFEVPDVEVNPRYGTAVEVGAGLRSVELPEGPRAAPAGGGLGI